MSDSHPAGPADGGEVNWTNFFFLDGERVAADTLLEVKHRSRYASVLFVTLVPASGDSGEAFGLEHLVESNGRTYAALRFPSFMSGEVGNAPMLVIKLADNGQATTIAIDELERIAPALTAHVRAGASLDIGLAEKVFGKFPNPAAN